MERRGEIEMSARTISENVIRSRFHWQRRILLALFAAAALAALMFGLRTYHSYLLLRSAYALGALDVASVRPWMTLDYVARTYGVPGMVLAEGLDLPSKVDPKTALRSLAERQEMAPLDYTRRVQEAISKLRPMSPSAEPGVLDSTSNGLSDEILAALLIYGYPILGLTLMLGAFGVPFLSGLSVVVAGSLVAQGQMNWVWAGSVVVVFSVLGDLAGYGLGNVLGREFFERRGRWLGLTPTLRRRFELFFQRWGILTVVLSRSLLSLKSLAVNLLAGASRYRLRVFLLSAVVGRVIWSSTYLGLGYGFGVAIEAAADFTGNLSAFLVSLVILAALGFMMHRNDARVRRLHTGRHPG